MIEQILANLNKVEIPLPKNPLKTINSYVIKNSELNLIIDTGWNQEETMNAMQTGLRELGVDITKADFFITHLHPDHLGFVSNLATRNSTIYFNQKDEDRYNSGIQLNLNHTI
jgi:glyoxylase-like metal-dependent hydrolase (beta-lactamase superfamily II)